MIFCALIFLLVLAVKNLNADQAAAAREAIGRYIGYGADYEQVMATVGRAVSEKKSLTEVMESEAIKVFGSSLLYPGKNKEGEAGTPDQPLSPPEEDGGEKQLYAETDKEQEALSKAAENDRETPEKAESGAWAGGEEEKEFLAGTGEEPLFPSFYAERESADSEPVVISKDFDQMERTLISEPVIDTTPATEFEIPSPDQVDESIHSLPFKYSAPLKGKVTSGFGYRVHPISKETTFHYGVDIAASLGDTIKSFAAGTVTEVGTGTINGKYVKVDHGEGYWTRYCHLSKISVKKGDKVALGEKLGEAGTTGQSTGVHLHFEVRWKDKLMNPADYLSFS